MRARAARERERGTHVGGLAGHHLAHRRDVVAVGKRAVAKRAVRVRAIVLADVAAASARRGESARGPATGEAGRARRAREETDARVTARQTARHVHAALVLARGRSSEKRGRERIGRGAVEVEVKGRRKRGGRARRGREKLLRQMTEGVRVERARRSSGLAGSRWVRARRERGGLRLVDLGEGERGRDDCWCDSVGGSPGSLRLLFDCARRLGLSRGREGLHRPCALVRARDGASEVRAAWAGRRRGCGAGGAAIVRVRVGVLVRCRGAARSS